MDHRQTEEQEAMVRDRVREGIEEIARGEFIG
jgi:hypothetical protein